MKEGFWINYAADIVIEIDEHEQWLRRLGNTGRLGVSEEVQKAFSVFKPGVDRDRFLLFVIGHAPVMRVRGHGGYVTFEFASNSSKLPLTAIIKWCKRYAGPHMSRRVHNFETSETMCNSGDSLTGGY